MEGDLAVVFALRMRLQGKLYDYASEPLFTCLMGDVRAPIVISWRYVVEYLV